MKKFPFYLTIVLMILIASCGSNKSGTETNESAKDEASESVDVPKDIKGEEVTYDADSISMNGFIAYDANQAGPRPGILVVHEWWGHNDYARKRAEMLAEMGYVALAVDMYGDGKQADHPDDAAKFSSAVSGNMEGAKARFLKALDVLKSNAATDSTKIAAIGYCFGGGVVLNAARFGFPLQGVVSFHGSLDTSTPAKPGDIKATILVCHGADDPFVSPEAIEAFKKEMDEAGANYTFNAYDGAKHSFTNQDATAAGQKFNMPLEYNQAADSSSWAEMTAFFENIFE